MQTYANFQLFSLLATTSPPVQDMQDSACPSCLGKQDLLSYHKKQHFFSVLLDNAISAKNIIAALMPHQSRLITTPSDFTILVKGYWHPACVNEDRMLRTLATALHVSGSIIWRSKELNHITDQTSANNSRLIYASYSRSVDSIIT